MHEKTIWGSNLGQNDPKSGPKLVWFVIFSSLVHYFALKLHRMIAWNKSNY